METLYDAYCTAQRSGAALVAHVRRQGLKKHQIARDFRITQKEADLYIWLGHQFTAKLLMLAAEKQLSVSQLQVVAKAANKASANLVDKQALRQEFINHAATCTVDELHLYVNTRVLEVNSGRAPRKAATGISKQADADGMGHIHAAIPYHEAKKVSAILAVREFPEDQYVFFATAQGMVKKVQLSAFKNVRSQGIKAIALKEGDYLVGAAQTGGADDIMLFSNLGKAIRFNEYWEKSGNDDAEDADIETENEDSDGLDDENAENALPSGKHGVRPSGRGSGGLRGMRLPADGKIVSLITFAPEAEQSDLQVLTATANGYGKRTPIADYSRKNKGGQGNIAINTGERNGDLVAATLVSETDDLMLITSGGVLIRTKVEQIRETGRAAAGVRLINLDEGETLVSLERVAEEAEDEAPLETDAAENQVVEAEDTPSQES